jgi:hypothetical protein
MNHSVTVGSSEDQWKSNKEYEVHRRNQVSLEGIRFGWKESGLVERNQVWLEGIRFHWKESGLSVGL